MTSFCLLLFIASPILGLPSGEVQAQRANDAGPEKATDCKKNEIKAVGRNIKSTKLQKDPQNA